MSYTSSNQKSHHAFGHTGSSPPSSGKNTSAMFSTYNAAFVKSPSRAASAASPNDTDR